MTGNKIRIHGKVNLTVNFGGTKYYHGEFVTGITDPCKLGLDFLKKFDFKLDFKNNKALSKFEEISLFELNSEIYSIQSVIAKQDIDIAPRTEFIVPTVINNETN